MARLPDKIEDLSDTICLSRYDSGGHKGFWLHDKTRGMNLAMRAETERDAFVNALTYYQRRLQQVESEYAELSRKVDDFVAQFADE